MKPINNLCALILGALTLFSISNANAGGCSSHTEKKAEIECLSDDKKCIETVSYTHLTLPTITGV